MDQLQQRLQNLIFHAELHFEFNGMPGVLFARGKDVVVEVPDLATGLAFCQSALPRDFRRGALQAIAEAGLRFVLKVRRQSILEVAKGKSGALSLLGLPHLRFRPIALGLALIGR